MCDWNEKLDITAENFGSVVWLWLWGSDSSFNILLYTVDLPWEIICNSDLVETFFKAKYSSKLWHFNIPVLKILIFL